LQGHVSPATPVPSGKQATAPVGSAIWQAIPPPLDAHDVESNGSQLFTGKQR
jgi:hypothetical protein